MGFDDNEDSASPSSQATTPTRPSPSDRPLEERGRSLLPSSLRQAISRLPLNNEPSLGLATQEEAPPIFGRQRSAGENASHTPSEIGGQ